MSEATIDMQHEAPLLVVLPSGGPAAGRLAPSLPILGVPRRDRIRLAAQRAGLVPVEVGRLDAALTRSPASGGQRRVVLLADTVLPRVTWLRTLAAEPLEPEQLYVDAPGVAVLDAQDPRDVLTTIDSAATWAASVAALRLRLPTVEAPGEAQGRFVLVRPDDVPAAETWLLADLLRPHEGFMSRHFERRLSLAMTRRLARYPITPNAVTLVSLTIGFASAFCFVSSRAAWQLLGAGLLLLHSIVDGCDGELARLKFLESPGGAALDFWGDNLVHVAVFGALALGWHAATGAAWPLAVGAITVAATVGSAWTLRRWAIDPAPTKTDRTWDGRLVDALAHRDFVYLVLVLAATGRAAWFLVPAAVGTPLFLAVALWSTRSIQRPARVGCVAACAQPDLPAPPRH